MRSPSSGFVVNPTSALPFWLSLALIPIAALAAAKGGLYILLLPLSSWGLFSVLDFFGGLDQANADLSTTEDHLFWHKLITLLWAPVQLATIFGMLWYVPFADHLDMVEKVTLFMGVGILSGTIGINYSHELMHQKPVLERWMADILLASVLYSHFRSEHLRVHHLYVGTPRDPVTARYNEGFHRFFPRVLHQCLTSAWKAEAALLARKAKGPMTRENPFFRYAALQISMLIASVVVAGWLGLVLFAVQAFSAILQLELVNYIEHYGLTRRHLGQGKYEHVLPRHSWNAEHRVSNWLLINLQRHSDHHYKPDRRFPLLQTYPEDEAPKLPFSYPIMTMAALVPPIFKRIMNPRVKAWRRKHYGDISDWHPYNKALNPQPR